MSSILICLVLAQATMPTPPPPAAPPTIYAWNDGHRTHWLTMSPTLVAEPNPSDAVKAEVLRVDASARALVSTPVVRLWEVRSASFMRTQVPSLIPAFHDGKTAVGRVRVPLGLVCDGQPRAATWAEALSQSGANCLPDFWYPPVRK